MLKYLIALRFYITYLQPLAAQLNNYYMNKPDRQTERQIINL